MTEIHYLDTRVFRGNSKKTTHPFTMYKEKSQALLQPWIIVWFIITAVICIWDATFIVLRPDTLPGGSLHWLWALYRYYIVLDQRYFDTKDAFVFAQSLLNYLEVCLNIATLVMHHKRSKHTVITAFTVSVMTFWKTVLYLLMFTDFVSGGEYKQNNAFMSEVLLVWIPNGVWIVLPLAVVVSLWNRLLAPPSENKNSTKTQNGDNQHGPALDKKSKKSI